MTIDHWVHIAAWILVCALPLFAAALVVAAAVFGWRLGYTIVTERIGWDRLRALRNEDGYRNTAGDIVRYRILMAPKERGKERWHIRDALWDTIDLIARVPRERRKGETIEEAMERMAMEAQYIKRGWRVVCEDGIITAEASVAKDGD